MMTGMRAITSYPPFNTIGDEQLKKTIKKEFQYTTIPPYILINEQNKKISKIGYVCSGNIDLLIDVKNGFIGKKGSIGKGEYFGVESLFNTGVSLFDELTTEHVECFILEKEKFLNILSRHKGIRNFFENVLYEKFKEHLYDSSPTALPEENCACSKEAARINKSITYIDENYAVHITLDDLARITGLSRFHYSRLFKLATGHTFKNYLNIKRLEAAKKLLKIPEVNISQACYASGFNDVSYFSRLFKKHEGINPTAYKKNENVFTDMTISN